ncbi:MAG: aminopeptidase [Clostridia bacterium]|nr:aminopeptidase [Clostridia bacterium]
MEKTEGEVLKEKLFNEKKSGWNDLSEEDTRQVFRFADEYMFYLNQAKTEKEIVHFSKEILLKNDFKDLNEVSTLNPGDKVFWVNRNRSLYIAVIGKEKMSDGVKIVAAHGDSPRIDLKQNPLYEEGEIGLLKTHYYGGIKKYQWATVPLSMHGIVAKTNGERVNVTIGESEKDPVFYITDLPPHLSRGIQDERKLAEGITGEELNIVAGTIPYYDKKISERVKLNILKILNEKYGIKEVDFTSSELEFVPSYKARSVGFDESLVGAYGQDDKVCCYTSLRAILDAQNPVKTSICVLTDKEEIGFCGVTGMESHSFERFMIELLEKSGENMPGMLEKVYSNSNAISADVDAGYDPTFTVAFDSINASRLGHGVCICKYTGARGKSSASEAPAEFVANIRRIFDDNNVAYCSSELGKVDKGGGGTIAVTLANRGIDTLDIGIPVLSMHSPYELTSKFDVYDAFRAYRAFFND